MNIDLTILEEVSLDLKGWVESENIKKILPAGICPIIQNGKSPIKLQTGRIRQIIYNKLPFIKLSFDKSLWEIAIDKNNEQRWFIFSCDVNNPLASLLGKLLFNYKINDSSFTFLEKRKSLITSQQLDMGGELKCHVEFGKENNYSDILNPLYILKKSYFKEITLQQEPLSFCRIAKVDIIKDDISPWIMGTKVEWEKECLIYRGAKMKWKEE